MLHHFILFYFIGHATQQGSKLPHPGIKLLPPAVGSTETYPLDAGGGEAGVEVGWGGEFCFP